MTLLNYKGTAIIFLFFLAMRACLLLFLALLLSVVSGGLPQDQKESLLSLFDATGGPHWRNKENWYPATDPCDDRWFGVSCDYGVAHSGYDVTSIKLDGNNLIGSLPDLQLPYLKRM